MNYDYLFKHGHTSRGERSPEYNAYIAAKQRCSNPKTEGYELYGGRGVQFLFESFTQFYAELGARPSTKHSLDRYPDLNGHYEAGNVRWATIAQQQRNKRTNRRITYNGNTLTLADWAERTGIKSSLLRHRLNAHWCLECVFNLPLHSSCRHRASGTKYDARPERSKTILRDENGRLCGSMKAAEAWEVREDGK